MGKERLSKVLARAGIASRRHAEELIFQGLVKVNGKKVMLPQTLVDPEEDTISLNSKILELSLPVRYFVLNKPKGVLCSNAPSKTKRAVDLIDTSLRLFTIGRLDKETEGLLLLTNDGFFAHKLMHPSFRIEKEYVAKVDREILHEHLVGISQGCRIERGWVKPVSVQKVRKGTVRITVVDGKKHEVRELLEHVGCKVVSLKRIRVGALTLGKLPLGAYYEIPREKVESLFPHAFSRA